jgi:hypothetical protein|tara:strand:- start:2423 stop:2707 length:285 start_codon:yes stop_codon:yes gene_type:complete
MENRAVEVRHLQDKLEAGIAQGLDYWITQVRFNEARDTVKIKTIEDGTVYTATLETFARGWIRLGYRGLEDHQWDDDHADAALQQALFNKVVFG